MTSWTALHLFCGLGGGGLGFKRAGFSSIAAIDVDPAACRDYERLTGEVATCADLGQLSPEELRAIAGPRRPDVVFTSPPCKAFSGCLPAATACTPRYVELSDLSLRGVWLALEAWTTPPPLILLENVPRIQSRGSRWLEQLTGLLHAYGYALSGDSHDCGDIGGLAQRRRRYLLIARHMEQVPEVVYRPPLRRVRGIGEVLGELPLPLPGSEAGGPMHRLPRLSAMNWLRLALIPAGGDWRDLPDQVAVACSPRSGTYGVRGWDDASGAVIASARHDNGAWTLAAPRAFARRREGALGVKGWGDPSTTVIANPIVQNGPWQVADPRLSHSPRAGGHGVMDWSEAAPTVRAVTTVSNSVASVTDPRLPPRGARQNGGYGVNDWSGPAHTVVASATVRDTWSSVADPRCPLMEADDELDLDSPRPCYLVIRAVDGTWHRPLTTLELAALQGLPVRQGDGWLELDGRSHQSWRQRIGNAVPPPAAEAIARQMIATLEASRAGRLHLGSTPVWVEPAVGGVAS